jgi:putative component of toxin-antitoxin plasmid stabilization module
VLVWNWQADKVEFVHSAATGGVTEVRISGDGKQIVFADRRKAICSYPLLGGFGFKADSTSAMRTHASGLSISHDGSRVLVRVGRTEPFTEMMSPSPGKVLSRRGAFASQFPDPISAASGQKLRVIGNSKGGIAAFESPDRFDGPEVPLAHSIAPFDHVYRVYVSRDDEFAMGTTSGGDFAARPADANHALWVGSIPDVRIRDVRSDFRRAEARSVRRNRCLVRRRREGRKICIRSVDVEIRSTFRRVRSTADSGGRLDRLPEFAE